MNSAAQAKVSIIIPTLNEEKLIAGLLARFTPAIREQLRLEIILSDGGSTDQTLALARGLANVIVIHPGDERQTIAAGRNAGAQQATGEVFLFFNADVELPVDLASFLKDLVRGVRQKGAATCRVAVHPGQARWMDRLVLGTCDRLFWMLNQIGIGMGRGECHAIDRALFEHLQGYNETLVAGEDFDLFHRIARYLRKQKKGSIAFLWNWTLYEDPRRYRELGYPRTMWSWFENFISILFTKRSRAEEWSVIR